jgi:hypothetical protein
MALQTLEDLLGIAIDVSSVIGITSFNNQG